MNNIIIESDLKFKSEIGFHDNNLISIMSEYNYICGLKENLKNNEKVYSKYDEKHINNIENFNYGKYNKKFLLNFGEFIGEVLKENNLDEINYDVLKKLLIDGMLDYVNFDEVICLKNFNPDVDFLNTLFKFRSNATITKIFFEYLYKNSDEIFKISLDSILNISENVLHAVNDDRVSKCDRIGIVELNKLIKNNVFLKSIYPNNKFKIDISYDNSKILNSIFEILLELSIKNYNVIDFNIEKKSNFNESIFSKFLYVNNNNLKDFINKKNVFGNNYLPLNAYTFNEIIKSNLYSNIDKKSIDVFKHLISVSLFKKSLDESNINENFVNLDEIINFINDENVFDKNLFNHLNYYSTEYNSTASNYVNNLFLYYSKIDINEKAGYLRDDYYLMFHLNNNEDKFLSSDKIIKEINLSLIEKNSDNVINILLDNKNFDFVKNIKRIKHFLKMEYFSNENNINDFNNINVEDDFKINNEINNLLIDNLKNDKLFKLIFGNESSKKIFNLSREYMVEISQIIDINNIYKIDMVLNYINKKHEFILNEFILKQHKDNINDFTGRLFNEKELFDVISKSTLVDKENMIVIFDNLIDKLTFRDIYEKSNFINNYFKNIYSNILSNKNLLNTKDFVEVLFSLKNDFKLINNNHLINVLLKLNIFNDKNLFEECLSKGLINYKDKIEKNKFNDNGDMYIEIESLDKIAIENVTNTDIFKSIVKSIGITSIKKPDFFNLIMKLTNNKSEIDKEIFDYLIEKKVDLNKVFKFKLSRSSNKFDKWENVSYESFESITSLILFNALENNNYKLFKHILDTQPFEFEELINKNKKNKYLSICIEKIIDIIMVSNNNSEELLKILMGNKHFMLFKNINCTENKMFNNQKTLSNYFKHSIFTESKQYTDILIENLNILEDECNIFKLENINNNALICLTNDKFNTNQETITQDKDLLKIVLNSSNYNLIKEMRGIYFLSSIVKIKVFLQNIEYFPFTIDSLNMCPNSYINNSSKDFNKLKVLGALFIHENDLVLLNQEKEKICKLFKINIDDYQEILINTVKDIANNIILNPEFNNKIENEFKLNPDDIFKKIKEYENLIVPKTIATKKIRL